MTPGFDPRLGFPEVPPGRIAQAPPADRVSARLLVLDRSGGVMRHRRFSDLPDLVQAGDALVLNDVRVLPARLLGRKPTGGRVALLLLARFPSEERWTALISPRPRIPSEVSLEAGLSARILASRPDGEYEVLFSGPPGPVLERHGRMPLPPYIRRPAGVEDREAYQTVFSRPGEAAGAPGEPAPIGAVAAPTAGLHFNQETLGALAAKGVRAAYVTLWVGWGTFRPVKAGDYRTHQMLAEPYRIPPEAASAINSARAGGRRVWAVGTTVVRALESAADEAGRVSPGAGQARLFITPGYRFRAVDALVTNFHLPGHTPLLLAAAFAGTERLRKAYLEALASEYRFLSYGDAMAIL